MKATRKIISVGVSADQLSDICRRRNSIVRFHPQSDIEYFASETALFIGLRYNERTRTMFFDFLDDDNDHSDVIAYNNFLSETAWEIEVFPEEDQKELTDDGLRPDQYDYMRREAKEGSKQGQMWAEDYDAYDKQRSALRAALQALLDAVGSDDSEKIESASVAARKAL